MIVEAPDGKVIEFPESMDEKSINAAMAKEYPTPAFEKPKKSFLQETASKVAPYLPVAGATAGGILAAPANIIAPGVAEALGVGGGYLMGKEGERRLQEYAGERKPPEGPLASARDVAQDLPGAAETSLMGPAVGKVISGGAALIGKVGKQVLGRMSGAGTGAVEEAVASGEKTGLLTKQNPFASKTAFDKSMRGEISGEEIVGNAKDALNVIKDARATEYRQHLSNISGVNSPNAVASNIDLKPIVVKLKGLMDNYNIKAAIDPQTGDFILDTSRVAMGHKGIKDIEGIVKELQHWGSQPGDKTAIGLDALKRRLDDFYSESSQARQFVASMRDEVRKTIVKAVPEYGQMTKGYAEATKLIKDLETGLSLRKQGMTGRVVADQTLRRLTSSMRDNFELRRDLVKVLSSEGGQDLGGQIAGYSMRSAVPLGLAGTGPALVGEYALARYVSPKFWPVLAASSPRLQGEFLRLFGKGLAEVRGLSGPAGTAATAGIVSNQEQIQQKVRTGVDKPNELLGGQ